MIDPLSMIYSTDASLTISQIKDGNYDHNLNTEKRQAYCEKYKIGGLTFLSRDYPKKFREWYAPFIFYYQGNLELLNQASLGIVGPRKPSEYGIKVLEHFFDAAKQYHIVTISGFAKGIDQKAHELSLKYQLPTIVILGGGFQHYLRDKDHIFLEQIVAEGGLIISEFKLGFQPTFWSFPQRNKLIARLSDFLFLPEAREKSGSLITAEFAYHMGKKIISVPAPIFSTTSAGIFSKMQEKKLELITDFDLRLKDFFPLWSLPQQKQSPDLNAFQIALLSHFIDQKEIEIEQLLPKTQLSYERLLQELTLLEMSNTLEEVHPGSYRKKK